MKVTMDFLIPFLFGIVISFLTLEISQLRVDDKPCVKHHTVEFPNVITKICKSEIKVSATLINVFNLDCSFQCVQHSRSIGNFFGSEQTNFHLL